MKYRPEIDGLRAVAVLPVILFHAGFSIWSGGFVGVDVFFVISGYLITTILIQERTRGTYSLIGFYERRARRILPALFVVFLCCLGLAWLWIPPYPFEDFGRSLAMAALFVSNIHFLEHGGYFDVSAELRPLLHTWSLAVEEQYYLLFPLVLMALGRFRRLRYLLVLGGIALISLAIAEWGWRNYPAQNFYFTPSRFWELLAGSLCAVMLFQSAPHPNQYLAVLGLGAVVGSVLTYDSAVPFPSVYTLVPVVGTCLIILFAGAETWVGRVLAWRPMVGIGLISYSAYLWHQPVFAFARIRFALDLNEVVMLGLGLLSLALAWMTWAIVEQPFRGATPRVLPRRKGLLNASLLGILAFAVIGFGIKASDGLPTRLDTTGSAWLETMHGQATTQAAADLCPEGDPLELRPLCTAYQGTADGGTLAVLGDSHARAMLPAFRPISDQTGATILLGDRPSCPPLLDVYLSRGGVEARICQQAVRAMIDEVIRQKVETVILVARWSYYATGEYDGPDPKNKLTRIKGQRVVALAEWHAAFEHGLRQSVQAFQQAGIDVLILQQAPQQEHIPVLLIESAMMLGMSDADAKAYFEQSYVAAEDNDRLQSRARAVIARVADDMKVPVLDLNPLFRKGARYVWLDDATSLYLDDDHVSDPGALRVTPLLSKALSAP